MADYIQRQAAIDTIKRIGDENYSKGYPMIGIVHAIQILERLPASDVEPVVHAEWRNNKNDYPECTNCGYMPAYDPEIDDIWYSPRCPKCGARMKNGEELE